MMGLFCFVCLFPKKTERLRWSDFSEFGGFFPPESSAGFGCWRISCRETRDRLHRLVIIYMDLFFLCMLILFFCELKIIKFAGGAIFSVSLIEWILGELWVCINTRDEKNDKKKKIFCRDKILTMFTQNNVFNVRDGKDRSKSAVHILICHEINSHIYHIFNANLAIWTGFLCPQFWLAGFLFSVKSFAGCTTFIRLDQIDIDLKSQNWAWQKPASLHWGQRKLRKKSGVPEVCKDRVNKHTHRHTPQSLKLRQVIFFLTFKRHQIILSRFVSETWLVMNMNMYADDVNVLKKTVYFLMPPIYTTCQTDSEILAWMSYCPQWKGERPPVAEVKKNEKKRRFWWCRGG